MQKMSADRSVLIACVGDQGPQFEDQALRLVTSAMTFGNILAENIVVGWIGDMPARICALQKTGIDTSSVRPATNRPPHCNKLTLVEDIVTRRLLSAKTHLILLDCDIAFAAPMAPNVICSEQVMGRVAGFANPPMNVWRQILDECGLTSTGTIRTAFDQWSVTPCENLNGGVLSFPTSMLADLMPRWNYWVDWLVARRGALGHWSFFTDQTALALALMERRSMPRHLPLEYNLAWATPHALLDQIQLPVLLHYHQQATNGRLLETGHVVVDEAIKRINGMGAVGKNVHA